jgi:hypothetical protein
MGNEMTNNDKISSSADSLLREANDLLSRSRATLAGTPATMQDTEPTRSVTMSIELTSQRAGELYASGQTVIEVARAHGLTYGQAHKLIKASGTPIRNASDRLKGRTRAPKA